jgi:hypothetical protein
VASSRTHNSQAATEAEVSRRFLRMLIRVGVLAIVVAGTVGAYVTSFEGDFVLDGVETVRNNSDFGAFEIDDPDTWGPVLTSRRPVSDITFAINHALARDAAERDGVPIHPTAGYHAVNLVIHLAAVLVLFELVRRILLLPRFDTEGASLWVAGAIALLWGVHPLTTQAVTYIVQRAESLTALFYLLTLLCLLLGATAQKRAIAWYVCAILACCLGMLTKGVMITAPLAALLFDRCFLSQKWSVILRTRWPLHLSLWASTALLFVTGVANVAVGGSQGSRVGFNYQGHTWLDYLFTQPGVILHYLRLVVWPDPLVLDYGWPIVDPIWAGVLPGLLVLALLAGTVWLVLRRSAIGFAPLLFFVVLAPTSSVLPISDPAFEHRMYLPLAGVITSIVIGGWLLARTLTRTGRTPTNATWAMLALLTVGIATALGVRTGLRNLDYRSEYALLQKQVEQWPASARVLNNLGHQKSMRARLASGPEAQRLRAEAIEHFAGAVELPSDDTRMMRYNLATELALAGRTEEAEAEFRRAEDDVNTYGRGGSRVLLNYGLFLLQQEREVEAEQRLQRLVGPEFERAFPQVRADAYNGLGEIRMRQGRYEDALALFRMALEIVPEHAFAPRNVLRAQQRLSASP